MNRLSLCLRRLKIGSKLGHRTSERNSNPLALLLDGGLYSRPHNIIYGKLVTEDNLLILVNIYNGSKTRVVRCKIV